MRASKLPQNHENEYGFAKLKPPHATEAHAHLGESEARDECCHHAQSRASKLTRFSRVSSRWGGEGGDPPRHSIFLFSRKT